MLFKFKKFIYLLNDATNTLLSKDREEEAEKAEKLRKILFVVSILLISSLIINIYFLINNNFAF